MPPYGIMEQQYDQQAFLTTCVSHSLATYNKVQPRQTALAAIGAAAPLVEVSLVAEVAVEVREVGRAHSISLYCKKLTLLLHDCIVWSCTLLHKGIPKNMYGSDGEQLFHLIKLPPRSTR